MNQNPFRGKMKPVEHKPKDSINYYYAHIPNPVDFRKTLLEASRDTILILKQYETFKSLRKAKAIEYEALKKLINEINTLLGRLKKLLPASKIRETIPVDYHKASRRVHPVKKHNANPVMHKQPKNNIEKLENELNVLEERLQSLS